MNRDETTAFPADFPIKVMGRRGSDVRSAARAIIERAVGALQDHQIRERNSRDENFVAVTFMIRADSRDQLDAIYRELTACAAVLMAL